MNKKKRAIAIIVTAAVIAAATFGIIKGVQATQKRSVLVVPASELNYGGWYSFSEMEGVVTSDVSQTIYVADTQTVKEVKVQQGDTVKKGDVLVIYDSRQAAINLEKEKNARDQLQLQMDVAEKNLDTLKKLTPYSETDDPGDDGGWDDFPDEPEPVIPDPIAVKVHSELTGSAAPFYDNNPETMQGDPGSELNPYRFLCKDGTVIRASFLKQMQKELAKLRKKDKQADLYFVIEVREGDAPTGKLLRAWMQNAATLWEIPDDWTGMIALSKFEDSNPTGPKPSVKPSEKDDDKKDDSSSSSKESSSSSDPSSSSSSDPSSSDSSDSSSDSDSSDSSSDSDSSDSSSDSDSSDSSSDSDSSDSSSDSDSSDSSSDSDSSDSSDSSSDSDSSDSSDDSSDDSTISTAFADDAEDGETAEYVQYFTSGTDLTPVAAKKDRTFGSDGVVMTALGDERSLADLGLIPPDAQYSAEEIKQSISDQEKVIRDIDLSLREADLKIKEAERALDQETVVSSMNGVVQIAHTADDVPNDGSAFVQVTSQEGLFVRGGLSELYLDKIKEGDLVNVQSWMSGMACTGTVAEISPYPDESNQFGFYGGGAPASTYPLTIHIDDPNASLTEGEWVQFTVLGSGLSGEEAGTEEGDGAAEEGSSGDLYLWKAFIREENGEQFVYKRDENGLLKKEVIKTGEISGEGYKILSGVAWQDYLAFPYGKNLEEGAATYEGSVSDLYMQGGGF